MWLLTPEAFVSVVAKDPSGQGRLCVRARVRADLLRIRRKYCPELTIPERGGTDYEWRSYCTHADWAAAVARMAEAIDYDNMKARVVSDARHNVYLEAWSVLRRLAHLPRRRNRIPFVCPRCGAVSHHPMDLQQGYCGSCHWWTGDDVLGSDEVVRLAEEQDVFGD